MRDVVIIGAGVIGCAIARELSKYELNICVVEKEEDVCCGTSKANSAIMHAGFDARQGSLMAKLNVRGNAMIGELARELDIPYLQNGSFVACTSEEDLPKLTELYKRGIANGVGELAILSREEAVLMEPNLSEEVIAVLYAKTAGIICPFNMTIAFAENACKNGVEFRFQEEVLEITKKQVGYEIRTSKGKIQTRFVINAAGVYADTIHNMVSAESMKITPRKGDYFLLDKTAGAHVVRTIFSLPGKNGKGVLIAPTIHGNLIVGPTAVDIWDKEGTNTTAAGLEELRQKANRSVKEIPLRQVITSFSGLRAHEEQHEFIIREIEDAQGVIDVAGMESPGLTSAPAVAELVREILEEKETLKRKENFQPNRTGILNPEHMSLEERNELILKEPAYGTIICRCEMISEGEILDAIRRPLGARSLDGIKRRARAGSGRCQAGFCTPKMMEILAREWKLPVEEITKSGKGSNLIVGRTKE